MTILTKIITIVAVYPPNPFDVKLLNISKSLVFLYLTIMCLSDSGKLGEGSLPIYKVIGRAAGICHHLRLENILIVRENCQKYMIMSIKFQQFLRLSSFLDFPLCLYQPIFPFGDFGVQLLHNTPHETKPCEKRIYFSFTIYENVKILKILNI